MPEDWQQHHAGVLRELAPDGALGQALAERVALCLWRLRRAAASETAVTAAGLEEADERPLVEPTFPPGTEHAEAKRLEKVLDEQEDRKETLAAWEDSCRLLEELEGMADDAPGSITFQPQGINRAWNLRNGMVGATFVVPPNARVGDLIPVEVQVTDGTQAEPFVCRFQIRVTQAAADPGPREPGPQPPRGESRLAMPKVVPVTRDGREIDGKPTVQWGNNNDFNEFTALEISPSGEEEGKYDIFVNMDNIHLVNELHRERRTSEHPLITYYFKYGLTLVAPGMLQEHQRREKEGGN
jgi:hypothetical protein